MEARLRRFSKLNREHTFYDSREEEEACHDRMFDPMIRRTVNINPSFRSAKQRVEFNPFRFLMERKSCKEIEHLQFIGDEDVQDHLGVIDALPNKERINLLVESVLRRIAEHVEVFNRLYMYKLLDVNYEKN